jgi:hypothetical protein
VVWVTAYDLRENRQYVESVRHATLNRPGYGLDPNPALFGSDQWWQSVADGRVPSKVEEVVVADVRWGSMGDWPERRFLSDDGRETTWPPGSHPRGNGALEGNSQMVRKLGRDPEHAIPLKVELEASYRRSERLGPGPFPGATTTFLRTRRRTTPSASALRAADEVVCWPD